MALGTNRDYKTADRRARRQLATHYERMQALIAQGMSREEASKQAYAEMTAVPEATARKRVNDKLSEISRQYHPAIPIADIDTALTSNGFHATEPAIYCGRDGRSHEQVGPRTWLSLSWHKMDESGRYEVTCYVS